MNAAKWIGCILLTVIVMGFFEDAKITGIVIGVSLASLILVISIINILDKSSKRRFELLKNAYPNAFSFFRKELRIFQSENNLTKQDINKFLSFHKTEWEKREKLELERIQREKQVSTEYNMIKGVT